MINSQEVKNIFKKYNCNRYAKKLKAHQLIILLILAQQNQYTGTRMIQTGFEFNRKLRRALKLESISHTQIFRRLQSFPVAAIEEIFSIIVKRLSKEYVSATSSLDSLNLIDASSITKSLKGMEWAKFRDGKAGVKLHLSLMYHDEICYPKDAFVSKAKVHDIAYFKDLISMNKKIINVFDRGYVDYEAFDEFSDAGIKFVTRLKDNAATWTIERYETKNDENLLFHDLVTVGSGKIRLEMHFVTYAFVMIREKNCNSSPT